MKFDPKILKFDPNILKFDPNILKFDPKITRKTPKNARLRVNFTGFRQFPVFRQFTVFPPISRVSANFTFFRQFHVFRNAPFDYVYFWKRNENIFVHFDWISAGQCSSGYHLDHDGKKVWFLFCRMSTGGHVVFETTLHRTGVIIAGNEKPTGLGQPAADVEKKFKLLTTVDKNCPLLQLSKRLLNSLNIKQAEYQTTSDGFVRAICYCPTCTTQRKEKTKLTGWVKFYLTSDEDARDGFRYFRPINKGREINPAGANCSNCKYFLGFVQTLVQRRTDKKRDIRDSTGGSYFGILDGLDSKCAFSYSDRDQAYSASVIGRVTFPTQLNEVQATQVFKNIAKSENRLTHIFVKCVAT